MLSSDVVKLYNVETKKLNQTINRNINRFPNDFYFQLTFEECSRFQFGTLNIKRGENIKYLPHVFTEQGIMMLSVLLKSDIAIKVNIQIIEAFVKLRKIVSSNLIEQKYINNMVFKHDEEITEKDVIECLIKKLEDKNE